MPNQKFKPLTDSYGAIFRPCRVTHNLKLPYFLRYFVCKVFLATLMDLEAKTRLKRLLVFKAGQKLHKECLNIA